MFEQFKETVRFIVCDYRWIQLYFHTLLHTWQVLIQTTETQQNLLSYVNSSSYWSQM